MKTIADLIVYGAVGAMVVAMIVLTAVSMRMAADEREFNRKHADDWNEHVKRMQAKGRWNDVE